MAEQLDLRLVLETSGVADAGPLVSNGPASATPLVVWSIVWSILIGTCGFSIYVVCDLSLWFFNLCVACDLSLLAHAVFQSMQTCVSECHSQWNMPVKNKDLPEYILIGTCDFSIYANLTFPKAIVNRSRATCQSIFPICLIKTKICQSTSLLAHAVFQSMQTWCFQKP